jgi:hypothetical protein
VCAASDSRLFVIDGSKALVAAIRKTFGRRALISALPSPQALELLAHDVTLNSTSVDASKQAT